MLEFMSKNLKMKPKLSIIIPALNEEHYLPKLLNCLKEQSFQDFEVIIADAGSTDKTKEIAATFGASIVPGGLPGVGRNNGAKVAVADLLLFIDADLEFDADFIEKSVDEFHKYRLDLACCLHSTEDEKKAAKYLKKVWNSGRQLRQWTKFPIGSTEFLIIKKKVFEKLKGFNEDIKLQEDLELIQRAVKNKYKFRILKTKMRASSRRIKQIGLTAVLLAGIIGTIYIGKKTRFFDKKFQDKVEKLYGGWGEFEKED